MPKASAKSKREVADSDTSDSGPDDVSKTPVLVGLVSHSHRVVSR